MEQAPPLCFPFFSGKGVFPFEKDTKKIEGPRKEKERGKELGGREKKGSFLLCLRVFPFPLFLSSLLFGRCRASSIHQVVPVSPRCRERERKGAKQTRTKKNRA
jgi:hypothetical protein